MHTAMLIASVPSAFSLLMQGFSDCGHAPQKAAEERKDRDYGPAAIGVTSAAPVSAIKFSQSRISRQQTGEWESSISGSGMARISA